MPKRPARPSLASRADKYDLYQRSVQEPSNEVTFFDRAFRARYGRPPLVLREDFCGTAAVCCEWVNSRRDRTAYGVDLDPEPVAWGEAHNLVALPAPARSRVKLSLHDARAVRGPRADVIAALNFSFCLFKTRDALRGYFEAARRNLAREGVLVLDLLGGWETVQDGRSDVRRIPRARGGRPAFKYVWEQARFDAITHDATHHIHFQFDDGSELHRAFSYDWRLWTLPELRELLVEAGFAEAHVYWEDADRDTGDGNGVYRRREHARNDPAWIASVVGVK